MNTGTTATKPLIVISPTPVDNGLGSTATVWTTGIRLPDGSWDESFPPRISLTEGEAWALAGLLSKASGHPVAGVHVSETGETIQ